MAKKKEQSYQELSRELDEIMAKLQGDDLGIDEAVKAYERGMELVTAMQAQLKEAENQVEKIKARFDKPESK